MSSMKNLLGLPLCTLGKTTGTHFNNLAFAQCIGIVTIFIACSYLADSLCNQLLHLMIDISMVSCIFNTGTYGFDKAQFVVKFP